MVSLNKLGEEIFKKLVDSMEGVGIDGVEIMQNSVPVASGWLKDHIDYNLKVEGDKIILSYNMPEYGKYVEYGTPPHFPPLEAIEEWCVDKGIDKDAAYPIAKAIERRGTRPQPFIRPFIHQKLAGILAENLKKEFERTP